MARMELIPRRFERPRARTAALVVGVALASALAVAGSSSPAAEPGSGEILYRRYCASCHGVGGRGDGAVAASLATQPTDLTTLSDDRAELMEKIDGRRTIRAHGTADMPVWGETFEQKLIGERHRRRTALLAVQAIADYVASLRPGGGRKPRRGDPTPRAGATPRASGADGSP
ncbi:MAG TPA: c-type cytochrome [Candidatus Binatia bacterium]|nr:c-type cytochrome [Candidatus Binatia bacterium]